MVKYIKIIIKFLLLSCILIFLSKKQKNRLISPNPNFVKHKNFIINILHGIYFEYFFNKIYLKENDPEIRASLQELAFIGKDDGKTYAIDEEDSGSDRYINGPKFKIVKEKIEYIINSNLNKKNLVIQIGSSNGRKIKYIAKKFKNVQCIGIDLFEGIVNYCNENNDLNNLSFIKIYAHKLSNVIKNYKFDNCIIFSSGSIQFSQPEHLDIFFKKLCNFKKIYFIFCEGYYMKSRNKKFLNFENSFYSGAMYFSHNYDHYANKYLDKKSEITFNTKDNSCFFYAEN